MIGTEPGGGAARFNAVGPSAPAGGAGIGDAAPAVALGVAFESEGGVNAAGAVAAGTAASPSEPPV